jgi:hypothetical protein
MWNACQLHDNKGGCPHCSTKLFEWDGMNVLTVATWTVLEMQNYKWAVGAKYWDYDVNMVIGSDKEEYETECWVIEQCIASTYYLVAPQSRYRDGKDLEYKGALVKTLKTNNNRRIDIASRIITIKQ